MTSYFEHVNGIHSINDSSSTWKSTKDREKTMVPLTIKAIPMLELFHPNTHPYIHDVMDVKTDGHCGYRSITALLGMGEDS